MAEVKVAAVAIGRNEGDRLVRCLASLNEFAHVIYVDSGSTDASVEHARAVGADVVELDLSQPFTAARARNTGLARLSEIAPDAEFVQVLDGDCELRDGWISDAMNVMQSEADVAVVFGRRRERFPEASIWNQLTDIEWDGRPGDVGACGGDALLRREAVDAVGGYPDDMIAGEEPEMCFRLRKSGWRIVRLASEMTWHDAAMTHIGQWWQRSRRTGHANAENAARHGFEDSERFRVSQTLRPLIWAGLLPTVAILGALISPWALLLLVAFPAQCLRLLLRGEPWSRAVFLTLGKFPEMLGVLEYWWGRLRGRRRALIEYK